LPIFAIGLELVCRELRDMACTAFGTQPRPPPGLFLVRNVRYS